MRIRVKLLLLVVLMGLALLVNLLALGFLARTVPTALKAVQEVGVRQQLIAVQMQAQLRDAEAALYRYLMEGETGFTTQFREQLQNFERNVTTYQAQAIHEEERTWAESLHATHQQAVEIGSDLIRLRDMQAAELLALETAWTELSTLLTGPVRAARQTDVAYQEVTRGMHNNLRDMFLVVTSYLTSPAETETVRFTEAVVGFRQQCERFRALGMTTQELAWAREIDHSFDEIQTLGSRLISRRGQLQIQFANFAAMLFHAGEEVLVGQIQPQAARNLAMVEQQLLSTLNFAVAASLVIALSISVLVGAVTLPLLRQMDAGILVLLQGARRVAIGNLDEPVRVASHGELSQLAEAFNAMMTDLATRERHLKARQSELEALRQVSLQLTSTLDPDRVLDTITNSALSLVDATEVHIFIGDPPGDTLKFAASAWRDEAEHLPARQPRADGLVATAARTGQPQVVNNADMHPLFDTPEARSWGIKAAAAFPLKPGDQSLGVFNISFDDRCTLSKDDLRILDLLADQAAIALENAWLYKNLAERETRLHTLAQKLVKVQEEERRLVGLDLHDGLTQLLLSANMHLNTLAALSNGLKDQARAELALACVCLRKAIEEARRIVSELRPAVLEEYGLIGGLGHYVNEMAQAENWEVEFTADPTQIKLDPGIEMAIFRITQEALTNVRKHAGTNQIRVDLRASDTDFNLIVQDWGRGFNPTDIFEDDQRLGLVGIHERAALLGGECQIESQPGQGARVWVRVPIR
jgi:signal transduction histidine kinase